MQGLPTPFSVRPLHPAELIPFPGHPKTREILPVEAGVQLPQGSPSTQRGESLCCTGGEMVTATDAEIKELHRRWRRREAYWHWVEIVVGLLAWAALCWSLVQLAVE